MRLLVHDVGHGGCISLVHDNGNVMLWDCGHNDRNRPSQFLPRSGIGRVDQFFVTNYDEDHISDLVNLRATVHLPRLYRNRSISADQLRALKLEGGPITSAMESMLDMIGTYTGEAPIPPPAFPGVEFSIFYNSFGPQFGDTNNISLVTFLKFGGHRFIIPGDLEEAGWRALLSRTDFQAELRDVNVFVASHHGRESGYCPEVFALCRPRVVVFSDGPILHATQEMANTYGSHATGVPFDGKTRRVLSTRSDGSISWNA